MLTEGHTDEMTAKKLSQTPNPPRILYTNKDSQAYFSR